MCIDKLIKIGLVQIGDKFGDQYYFPYSIGILQAYAQKNLRNKKEYLFLLPIYKRIEVTESIKHLSDADIIFFSTYVWNCNVNVEIAKGVKQNNSNCIIVFGGPQVPESPVRMEKFLRSYHFIDIACYGEGEITFLKILENIKSRFWEDIPSIGFLTEKGSFIFTPPSERIEDLNEIPSPYLKEIFDPLIQANPQERWSALIETNRGCPYTCTFCYWGKKTKNKIYLYDIGKVFKEIDWISQNKIEFVFCCDANFGILRRDIDIVKKVAENKKKYGYPMAFSVQNTKNSTEKIYMLQKILNDSGLQKGVNLALQSLNENTLKSINRINITNRTYKDLQQMFTKSKIPTFTDIIIGLPNETYDTFVSGISNVIENGQHNRIQFINLTMLENTEMCEEYYQKRYGLIIKESKSVSHHTSLDNQSDDCETQNLIIGTNTMPKKDWISARIFCWMVSLLYFNKLLQIPFILLNKLYSVGYKDLVEIFIVNSKSSGKKSEILELFIEKAKDIQNGGCEYVGSREWLNIWWPVDEYAFISLCFDQKLAQFYEEAESIIIDILAKKRINASKNLLKDAIRLNQSLIKLPFIQTDLSISLNYNIFEMYQNALNGLDVSLIPGNFNYIVDRTSIQWATWDEWLKDVVWYGTKKGAYLYDCTPCRT